jgi:hypothetical protein
MASLVLANSEELISTHALYLQEMSLCFHVGLIVARRFNPPQFVMKVLIVTLSNVISTVNLSDRRGP